MHNCAGQDFYFLSHHNTYECECETVNIEAFCLAIL